MITEEEVRQFTQEQIEKFRQRARETLIKNQECYVAQWIMQNPFANIADYMLYFYPEENNPDYYGVRMEKVNVQ